MPLACVLTTVWNEAARLPRWIAHYGAAVGLENLFVEDDGSDDGSTDGLGAVNVIRRPRGVYDERERTARISAWASGLLGRYDTVIYADADELLVPADGASLREWLARPHPPTVTAIGLDVLDVPGVDAGPLDPTRPLLAQRGHARLNPTYCKPLVTRAPIRWRPGLHFSDAATAFDGLLLLHTRYADRAAAVARLAQLRTVDVADQALFSTHWQAADATITGVLDAAAQAPWRPFTAADRSAWEALLTARLAGAPPNAVNLIRHLWDEHPSWFTLPEGLRCDG
ncbi:MAG: glycosyltransferase family 2 protein [Caulobacteraceae bacterium]|nr:glycosyltransferase family 2 protein [Caulobacter sp.]